MFFLHILNLKCHKSLFFKVEKPLRKFPPLKNQNIFYTNITLMKISFGYKQTHFNETDLP